MTEFNRQESAEAEGMPAIEDHPPGIDVETDQEGFMVPRDAPIAAGGDPAYPVTAAGQRNPESLLERVRREIPDVGASEMGVGGGVGTDEQDGRLDEQDEAANDGTYVVGAFSAGTGADLTSEALPVIDELDGDTANLADRDLADGAVPVLGIDPERADDDDVLVMRPDDSDADLSAEELAIHLRSDQDVL